MNIPDDFDGNAFLARIADCEGSCMKATAQRLPELGTKAPACWEALGMTLAMLDCAASCHWGCAQGDHRLEFLVGRAVNNAYAGLLLARAGYYDQALLMARSLGETGNLMSLFTADPGEVTRWKSLGEKERRQAFQAVKVRIRLGELNGPVVTDQDHYGQLSSFSVHADPNALPQAHNHLGRAITFPIYQEAGFLMCVNEIAMPTAFLAVFAGKLLTLNRDVQKMMQELGREVVNQLGGISVKEKGRPWFGLS